MGHGLVSIGSREVAEVQFFCNTALLPMLVWKPPRLPSEAELVRRCQAWDAKSLRVEPIRHQCRDLGENDSRLAHLSQGLLGPPGREPQTPSKLNASCPLRA